MSSNKFVIFLMSDVMAVGIQANVERISCLTHILHLAMVALDQVNYVFSFAGGSGPDFEGLTPVDVLCIKIPFSHVDMSGI